MADTPEGRVKKNIKERLEKLGILNAGHKNWVVRVVFRVACTGWYYMPTQNGMGVAGIPDFIGHYKGRFWSIEAKARGKTPNPNQVERGKEIRESGAVHFVMDDPDLQFIEFERWCRSIDKDL